MTTPLIMLALLTLPYLVVRLWAGEAWSAARARASAAMGLGAVFCFTGVGHFIKTDEMAAMLPVWVGFPEWIVILSGIGEIALGIACFIPKARSFAGVVAVALLIVLYPINIYAAINSVPMGGHAWGPVYLWIRTPLQLILICWSYWFLIGKERAKHPV